MLAIKEKRISTGMSQTIFAKLIGEKLSTVAMWETGKNTPRADKLPKLAAALNCSIDDLFRDEPEKP